MEHEQFQQELEHMYSLVNLGERGVMELGAVSLEALGVVLNQRHQLAIENRALREANKDLGRALFHFG